MPTPQRNDADLILAADVDLDIKAGEDPLDDVAKVKITAYTGDLMSVYGWDAVVIDLAGLSAGEQIPLCVDHNTGLDGIVGYGACRNDGKKLYVEGQISLVNDAAKRIVALSKSGLKFQASVGVRPTKTEWIAVGKSVTVNGRAVKSDREFALVKRGLLREVSIVALGADAKTKVSVAASADVHISGAKKMDEKFRQWLTASGWENPDDLSESQVKTLQAAYDKEQAPPAPKKDETPPAGDIDTFIEAQAAQTERIGKIRAACAGQHPDIEAKAIRENWTAERAELEVLRASRKRGPAIHDATPEVGKKVLECAVRLAGEEREEKLFKEYGEQTIEAAEKYRGIGVRSLVDLCCRMEGRPSPSFSDSPGDIMAAGFSTASLSGILSDSARKSMQAAYTDFASAARIVAKKLTASDFKTHTGYRLTGDFVMKEVGAGGELKHATIDEESYTYSVDTYGRIFGVTRKMVINDDLGAFTEIPRLIGRGAALALEQAFWTLVLANTSDFFGTSNSNYISGATTTLASAGLKAAVKTFRQLTDADGNPIMVAPKYLLVPPDLEEAAQELYVSTNLNTGGSATTEKVPNRNIHANKYVPVVSPYLSNSNYTGYSTTAWYLLADPADVACFGIAYLNGNERPTVEEADVRNDTLGQAWRGYFDFGVCQVDKRGGVMSKGAA